MNKGHEGMARRKGGREGRKDKDEGRASKKEGIARRNGGQEGRKGMTRRNQ